MRTGEVDAVIVVPAGYGAGSRPTPGRHAARPAVVMVYTDPSRQSLQGLGLPGRWERARRRQHRRAAAARRAAAETIQTENLNFISYFVPSMLGLSVMQVGIFAAIPLVADREKLILKRLAATPLRRWQLVGSNVLMRLLIALAQSVIIVGGRRRSSSASRSPAASSLTAVFVDPRRGGVPRARLRDRVVRQDRGLGQRHDQRRSSSR